MNVLLVSYYWPPDVSVGAVRWPPLVRELRERGHEVTVLTTSAFGTLPDDGDRVVRTRDLEAPGLARRLLRRPEAPATAGGAGARAAEAPRLLTDGPVPDAKAIGWLPFAIPALRRLVRERDIDVIVTNSPPESTHLAPLALGRDRPAWLVDLEDGWRFEPLRGPWPTRAQDRLDATLEARVMSRAEVVSSLTRPLLDDAEKRFGAATAYVPIALPAPPVAAPPAGAIATSGSAAALGPASGLDSDALNVVHTGGLSHARRRDPRGLFAALSLLPAGSRARLVLAGGLTDADRELIAAAPAGRVQHLGPLAHADALALQRAADVLLLLTSGPQRSMVTGKLFEYLGAGRPILALAPDNEAARIVRETRTGVVVDPADAAAIAVALSTEIPFAPTGLERFALPVVTDSLQEALSRSLTSRR